MPITVTLALILAAAIPAAATDFRPATAPATQPAKACPIVCENPHYDFGSVWGGETVTHDFDVKNVSTETVWVKAQHVCSCTGPSYNRVYQIGPGETIKIPVHLITSPSYATRVLKVVNLQVVPPPPETQSQE